MKQSAEEKNLQQKIFQMQCEICKALANPIRMAIVNRLDDGEIAASDLIADLGISKANLSKHITVLANGGIVESRRDGRQIFYRLIDPEIREQQGWGGRRPGLDDVDPKVVSTIAEIVMEVLKARGG